MISALPFETPKLAVSALVDSTKDFATLLDQRIAHYQQMEQTKLIDAKPVEQPETKPQVETKPPPARTPDRRFRRI